MLVSEIWCFFAGLMWVLYDFMCRVINLQHYAVNDFDCDYKGFEWCLWLRFYKVFGFGCADKKFT